MRRGNKCRCLGARHLQQVCCKESTRHSVPQKPVLGGCRDRPAVPVISLKARSICSYWWEKSWETEQSYHLSATLEVQKTLSGVLSAAARQEVRAVTCPGSQQQPQKHALSYQLLAWVCKQIKTESFRRRGEQKGRVTSGFWEKLTQDKRWITRVTDEGDTRKVLLALRRWVQRDRKFFCPFALNPKPATSS